MTTPYRQAIDLYIADYRYVSEDMAKTLFDMFSDSEIHLRVEDTKPLWNGGMLVELVLESLVDFSVKSVYLCLFDKDGNLNATVAETL